MTFTGIEPTSGLRLPHQGFGVFDMDDHATETAVVAALQAGYRLIDTAAVYGNEAGVGDGVRRSGVPRSEVLVTTKLWNSDHDDPRRGLERSLSALDLDYVDLYLIHWPDTRQGRFIDAWAAMQDLHADGLTRAVGVSNFSPAQLAELERLGLPTPAVNQIELHPLHPQVEALRFHRDHGIVTQAWSPFGRGSAFGLPAIAEIARRRGRTESQVVLRWHLQLGVIPLPKSETPARIRENADIEDFRLDDDEMRTISGLGTSERVDDSYYERFA